MIKIGRTVAYLRERLGISLRAAASELGISYVHLNRIEKNHTEPTAKILERFHDVWGIDVYMVAVCLFADEDRYPESMRQSLTTLKLSWDAQIEELIDRRIRDGVQGRAKDSEDCVAGELD